MASLNNYAKLVAPSQFRPEEDTLFRMLYSSDFVGYKATLIIYGYEQIDVDGSREFNGTKQTKILDSGEGGQWYEDFIVTGGTLGFSPTGTSSGYYCSGKMQAKVEIGNELDDNGYVINPIFTSNVVLVDMLVISSGGIYWLNTPYNTDCSRRTVSIYIGNAVSYGASGCSDIQSYRFWLYDEQKNLLRDTEELYDWDTNIQSNINYTYYNLDNSKTYYVRARIILNGGYSFYYDYEPIIVNYSSEPTFSSNFISKNVIGGVNLSLDLSGVIHNKTVFSRTELNANEYLEIKTVEGNSDLITVLDRYAIPNKEYIYMASVYNGQTIVNTYYTKIKYISNCICISDIFGCYTAVADITKHPISRNDRGSTQEAIDSKYPFHVINGSPDYDSGTIDAFFSDVDECEIEIDNKSYSDILRAWLNNGRAKFLSYYTGEAWIVTVFTIQTTDPDKKDIYNTTFKWTQIGDANKLSEYIRLGLVINNE